MKNIRDVREINENLRDMSSKNVDIIVKELDSSLNGLSNIEASNRLKLYGPNEIVIFI